MTETQTQSTLAEPKLGDARIVVRGLTRSFGEHIALQPTQLDIGRVGAGSITGLLGPNGSGKSTLLRMITGLLRPDAGEAFVDGVRLAGDGTAIRICCSYSPGELSLYDEMSGREHLRWLLRGRGRAAHARAQQISESFALPLKKAVRTYSHGMKRQLLFAATMAPQVRVRILDEPTEGLDPSRRADVLEILNADAEKGTTILLSSHHLGEVTRACDQIIFLNQGRILAIEQAADVESRGRMRVQLTYASEAECDAVSRELTESKATDLLDVRTMGLHLTAQLATDDPRAFLAHVSAQRDLPVPRTIAYGDISLEELYESLYGVEGV